MKLEENMIIGRIEIWKADKTDIISSCDYPHGARVVSVSEITGSETEVILKVVSRTFGEFSYFQKRIVYFKDQVAEFFPLKSEYASKYLFEV